MVAILSDIPTSRLQSQSAAEKKVMDIPGAADVPGATIASPAIKLFLQRVTAETGASYVRDYFISVVVFLFSIQ